MFNNAGGSMLVPPPSFGTNGTVKSWFNPAFNTTSTGVANTVYDLLERYNAVAYWKGTAITPSVNPVFQNNLNGRPALVVSCPSTMSVASSGTDPCNYWQRTDFSPAVISNFTYFVVGSTTKSISILSNSGSGAGAIGGIHNFIILPWHRDTNNGVGLSIGTNGASVIAHGSGFLPPACNYGITLGTGVHIFAVRVSSNTPSIFIDGTTQTRVGVAFTQGNSYAGPAVSSPFYGAFNGNIGEFLIYDKALSNTDLLTVFRYFAGRYRVTLV